MKMRDALYRGHGLVPFAVMDQEQSAYESRVHPGMPVRGIAHTPHDGQLGIVLRVAEGTRWRDADDDGKILVQFYHAVAPIRLPRPCLDYHIDGAWVTYRAVIKQKRTLRGEGCA